VTPGRREQLRAMFAQALEKLAVGPAVRHKVARHRPGLAEARSVLLLAFGKAARPMAQAALQELEGLPVRGLCAPPEPDDAPLPPLEVIAGGHPLPSAGSLRAAARALELCRTAAADDRILFLISGGGSSILELPLDPAVPLGELRALYQALLGCGAPITAVNTVRKHFSAVKGGRLAAAAAHTRLLMTLAVSDVPDEQPAALASGPTLGHSTTAADCRALLQRFSLLDAVPRVLRERLDRGLLPPPVPADHPAFARSEFCMLLDNSHARFHLRAAAAAQGLPLVVDDTIDDQPYAATAEHLLERLRRLKQSQPDLPAAILNGGEVTVALPQPHGTGGRNQQFALQCALRIAGEPIAVLSAGTDGIDGNSPAAGAIADGTTMARAVSQGLDADACLRRGDAFPLFDKLGDAIVTGPTGTNVRDVRLLVHE
jgi:hydroxypyruvate reductase